MVAAPDRGYRRRRPPGTPAAGAGTTGTTDREPWSGRPSPSAVREIAIVGSGPMSRMNDFNTQIIEEFRANEGKVGRQFVYAEQAIRYPGFAEYQAATDRIIPVVALDRR